MTKLTKWHVRPAKTQISLGIRMKKAWVLSYPLSAHRRLWSDWVDAQADLSLRWAHSHFVGFVMSPLKYRTPKPCFPVDSWSRLHVPKSLKTNLALFLNPLSLPDALWHLSLFIRLSIYVLLTLRLLSRHDLEIVISRSYITYFSLIFSLTFSIGIFHLWV